MLHNSSLLFANLPPDKIHIAPKNGRAVIKESSLAIFCNTVYIYVNLNTAYYHEVGCIASGRAGRANNLHRDGEIKRSE